MKVTVFKNIWETSEPLYVDVLDIFKRIKDGGSDDLINQIRTEKDKDLQDKLKMRLPSILFCGRFSQRKAECFLEHSGLICLDIDGVSNKDMDRISGILKDEPHTFGAFISPRGNGFKVIVQIAPDQQNHQGLFTALEKHYNKLLVDYTIDTSGKDISRVCYESFDPKM